LTLQREFHQRGRRAGSFGYLSFTFMDLYDTAELNKKNLLHFLELYKYRFKKLENIPDTERYAPWCYRLAKRFNEPTYLFSSSDGNIVIKIGRFKIYPQHNSAELHKILIWGKTKPENIYKEGVVIKFSRM